MWHLFFKTGTEGGRKRRREERRRSSTSGRKRGPPINIHLMHSYSRASGSLSPAAAFVLAGCLLDSLALCTYTQIPSVTQPTRLWHFCIQTLLDSIVTPLKFLCEKQELTSQKCHDGISSRIYEPVNLTNEYAR